MAIVLLNSSIIPANFEGSVKVEKIDLEDVKKLLEKHTFDSYIGHQSTADILTELLGVKVEMRRASFEAKGGDIAIVFQLLQRPPEGRILSKEEMESLNYIFKKIIFY